MALILLLFALLIPGIILRGYVLTWLWHWFVVPFGVTEVTIPWAVGLAAILSFVTYQHIDTMADNTKTSNEKIWSGIALMVAQPLGVLLIGWILSFWM